RTKLACVRCRRRKTKCSGSIPCSTCISGGHECVFYKKPRVIKVLDSEIQVYQDRIEELERELEMAKSPSGSSATSSDTIDRLNLSIWLGSASSELICWNLKQFKISSSDPSKSSEEIIISPNFSSFNEETTYDGLFRVENLLNSDEVREILEPLNYLKFLELFDNVVTFINAGYLIVDPDEFIRKGLEYFDFSSPQQQLRMDLVDFEDEGKRFFLLKMVTILALGEIYGTDSYVGIKKPNKWPSLPGSDYFRVVIKYMPSSFSLITFCSQPLGRSFEIIEMFGLSSLYLRIIDKKNAAVLFTLNALQLCISLNLHKEKHLRSPVVSEKSTRSINKIWWSSFCLNQFFSSRIAQPLLLSLKEIRTYNNERPSSGTQSPVMEKDKLMHTIISKYNFSSLSSMKYYVELAKISDRITHELYCVKLPFNNKDFLQSILNIIESLVQWVNDLPYHLKLKLPMIIKDNALTNRLICSLHLNYLHHIYLSSIPVLLNFVRMKIFNYYKFKRLILNPIMLNEMPKNISNLMHMLIKSCQLTTNIFMTLYRQRYLRVFGFTDLDFLFSCSLVFLICLILGVDKDKYFAFDEYLEISMNIMYEMNMGGNLVAKGKLNQILDLLREIEDLQPELQFGFQPINGTGGFNYITNDQLYGLTDNTDLTDLRIADEDVEFMNQILQGYDSRL
ncbi:uncharacterized protein CANTADRAFT_36133, partial [Suhomyces tanzawaensis NRRL Y-17324]